MSLYFILAEVKFAKGASVCVKDAAPIYKIPSGISAGAHGEIEGVSKLHDRVHACRCECMRVYRRARARTSVRAHTRMRV